MSENFRTGAGAASRPRDEDLIRERDSTTERFVGASNSGTFLQHKKPEDETPYEATWISYPLYVWPVIDPPTSDIGDPTKSKVYRPPGIDESDPTFYSVYIRLPPVGGVNNLLGLFIRSRPKGAVQWREEIDFREYTAELDQYSPANTNQPDKYAVQLEPIASEEYQVATRYAWTPEPGYEFFSSIKDGASFPRQQPIMVIDKTGNASSLYQTREFFHPADKFATFGEIDLIEGDERSSLVFSLGSWRQDVGFYSASFADTKQPDDKDREANTTSSLGVFMVHREASYFTYAEDATGIVVID